MTQEEITRVVIEVAEARRRRCEERLRSLPVWRVISRMKVRAVRDYSLGEAAIWRHDFKGTPPRDRAIEHVQAQRQAAAEGRQ